MNLFLSRLVLNPRSRRVASELAYPYEMHRTLMHAFPNASDGNNRKARDEFGVLFRAEDNGGGGAVKLYVQSLTEPDWSFLRGLDGYLCRESGVPDCVCKDILPTLRKIRTSQVLSFRLRANPTRRIAKADDAMKGKRVELRREEEQIDWLIRKGQGQRTRVPGGFDLVMKPISNSEGGVHQVACVNVRPEGKQQGRKKVGESSHSMTHFAVLFEGLLRVTDADAFLESLVRGIGSGKAYGFGLLSIAPVNTSGSEQAR